MDENPILVHKMLVPLDGSEHSEKALPWAVDLAAKHQAEIILLRVGEPDLLESQTAQAEECRHYLRQVKTRLKSEAFVKVQIECVSGLASQMIVEKARQLGVSMIVMNSHGRDGMTRWWMGSVAETVTRHAPCPVLLVRRDDPDHSQAP